MGKTQAEMDRKEAGLFENHPTLCKLGKEQWGYATLTTKVVAMQSHLVDKWIPSAKKEIKKRRSTLQSELKALGRVPSGVGERRALLGKVISTMDRRIESLICTRDTSTSEMNIAARTHGYARVMCDMIKEDLPLFLSSE